MEYVNGEPQTTTRGGRTLHRDRGLWDLHALRAGLVRRDLGPAVCDGRHLYNAPTPHISHTFAAAGQPRLAFDAGLILGAYHSAQI